MTDPAPRPFPPMVPLMFAAAIVAGALSAGVGFITPGVLIAGGMAGGPIGAVVVPLLVLGILGLLVAGADRLLTRQPGSAGRAALTVLAVGLVIAAEITVDLKATGGYPTGWRMLAPLAGGTGFGAALLVTRRLVPGIVGAVALLVVGVVLIALVQQATADNVYPPYVGP